MNIKPQRHGDTEKSKGTYYNRLKETVFALSVSVPLWLFLLLGFSAETFAVPDTNSVRITDVTPCSFSVVWMTDIAANPSVEVYSDSAMTNQITDTVSVTAMPGASQGTVQAATSKGIMKVMVSGLSASTNYYVRTVTTDPSNPSNIAYSPLYQVVTASAVVPYNYSSGAAAGFSNDLVPFSVYIRPSDTDITPGLGDLIVLQTDGSPYPVSAFVGEGIAAPEGIADLNNLFGSDGLSRNLIGGERMILMVYRGGGLFTLTHYRRVPQNGNMVYVAEPAKGFFADINLDGNVDDQDFALFKSQYGTSADDANFNPDFNFVDDPGGKVDARSFSKFSSEYGRTNVQ